MTKNKDDILKKCIRSVEPDKPASNFTEMVMNEIQAEVQNEVVINPALKSLLQQIAVEIPSSDFTQTIMSQVEIIDRKQEPIIRKNAWYMIGTAVAVLIGLLGFSEQASKSPQILTLSVVGMGNELSTIFSGISTVPSVYLLTVISISVLLLIDYFLRERVFSQRRGASL